MFCNAIMRGSHLCLDVMVGWSPAPVFWNVETVELSPMIDESEITREKHFL